MMKKTSHVQLWSCAVALLLTACGSDGTAPETCAICADGSVDGSSSGSGGNSSGSSGGPDAGGDPSQVARTLSVRVETPDEMVVEVVQVACSGECVDVVAVASGGNPPYRYEWENGSTDPERRICPDETKQLTVSATDTAIDAVEFGYDAETVETGVTAKVLDCSEDEPQEDCDLGAGIVLPEELTPDIHGSPGFFAGGADLPAGRYRIEYVDGCLKYDPGNIDWKLNGTEEYEYWIIGDGTDDLISRAPGVSSPVVGFLTLDLCVEASLAESPFDFDFSGGPLGVWQNDWKPEDNVPGPGGRAPTWKLTHFDCPQ